MGGGIAGLHHEVRPLGEVVAERPAAIFDVLESQLDSAPDEFHALFPL
jgi:hypothetical protein